jgi:TPR repeat protein
LWYLYRIYSGFDASGTAHKPLDMTKARHWLRYAALAGSADAQYELGVRALRGSDGFEKNEELPRAVLKQAAASGHEQALSTLQRLPAPDAQRNHNGRTPRR